MARGVNPTARLEEAASDQNAAVQSGGLNNPVDASVRQGVTPTNLQDGPVLGEGGEYLPAAYRIPSGSIRIDN